MYTSMEIKGYRGLDSLRLDGLSRINLLVGTNNSGKTSILECVGLLHSAGDRWMLQSILDARGEWLVDEDRGRMYDIRHLFAGHDTAGHISIWGERAGNSMLAGPTVTAELSIEAESSGLLDPSGLSFDEPEALSEDDGRTLVWRASDADGERRTRLFAEGLLAPKSLRREGWRIDGGVPPVQFIGTGGLTSETVNRTFGNAVMTDTEDRAVEALQIIEPRVERIATVPFGRWMPRSDSHGGIFVRLRGLEARVPLGSLGEGMRRMLGLALSLASARGGVLLVDEIDTGLHYSVMQKMWRMIVERSRALDVQVFATTHSRDCYESLGSVADADAAAPGEVSIHRVEADRSSTVGFGEHEVARVADRELEVR